MTTDLRIGILGAARVATYAMIAPAKTVPGVEVASVASRDPARATAYAAQHAIDRVHDTYTELIADPQVDLVYIATPPNTHAELALASLAAGKPTLVEKPFSMSADEARRVLAAAQAARVPVFEAMHSPHHEVFRHTLELIGGGAVGEVRSLRAEFRVTVKEKQGEFRWDAALGGGALMDLGVYPLAWCRRIAGEDFVVATAMSDMRHGVDAAFTARLEFSDGIVADVGASMISPDRFALLVVEGTKGRIVVVNPLAPQSGHSIGIERDGEAETITLDGPSTYEAQLMAVRDALCSGKPFPFPDNDFVKSMEAIERVRDGFAVTSRN